MLKLKRVDIHGFKSFYERTEMKFQGSGIAAVVGPNGCGKSNISDAISWVLGEQSAKTLRGTRMEDVIFAGTRERKPLGMAQVTLSMVDPSAQVDVVHVNGHANGHTNGHANGHLNGHAKPQEITITRRLYRSGESEYLIDGKSARLRDIQDLFSGTGLGPESYAIIEQGRIGQILSNKPTDRRAIIEEAAGIGKYKTRKRLAEAKLESSKQNLARVFDILEEVSRQVNSLKRQASKARRWEELRAELLAQLRLAVSGRFRMLEREAARLALDLSQAQGSFQDLSTRLQEQERDHTAVQESCYRTEAELTAARARVAELNVEAERTRGRLELQAKQIGSIDERLSTGEAETQELEARLQREQAELNAHAETMATLESESASIRGSLQAKTSERDAIQTDLRERERGLEASRTRVLQLLGEASTLRNQVVQIDEYLAAMERDSARSRKEEEGASADLARLEQVKVEVSRKLSMQQLELESLADRRKRVEEEVKDRQARILTSRQHLEEARGTLSRQKARRDSLDEILSHRAYTTESVKRLFTAIEHGQVDGFKPSGVLADFVEVLDPAWEKACETFLHEELEYVVVGDWSEAERGVEIMRAESDGRVTFLLHEGLASNAPDLSAETGIAGPMRNALRLTNGFKLSRLEHCFLTSDRIDAQRLSDAYPDCYFLLPDGVSYHGHAVTGGRKTGGGPLALKRELRELSVQVEAREREADTLTAELEDLERGAAQLAEELEYLRVQQQAQEKDALALGHEQRKLAEEFARAGSRLSVARLELERLSREDQRSRVQREQSQTQVAEREQQRFDQERALEIARGEYEGLQARAHAVGEEHSHLRAGLAGIEERLRAEKAAAGRIEMQLRQVEARRGELARELERMGVERARLLTDNIELDQRAAALSQQTASAAATVENLATQEAANRASLAAIEESLRSLRVESQAAQERRSAIELELVRRQAELRYLDETSRKDLNAGAEEDRGRRRNFARRSRCGRGRAEMRRGPREDRGAGSGESAGSRRIPGSAAALRLLEHPAAGPA